MPTRARGKVVKSQPGSAPVPTEATVVSPNANATATATVSATATATATATAKAGKKPRKGKPVAQVRQVVVSTTAPPGTNSELVSTVHALPAATPAAGGGGGGGDGGAASTDGAGAGVNGNADVPKLPAKRRKRSAEEAKARHRAVERRRVLKINASIDAIKIEMEKMGMVMRKDKASVLNSVHQFLQEYNKKHGNVANAASAATAAAAAAAAVAAVPAANGNGNDAAAAATAVADAAAEGGGSASRVAKADASTK